MSIKKYGTAEDILAARVLTEEVYVPQLGLTYIARGLTGDQRAKWESSIFLIKNGRTQSNPHGHALEKLVAFGIVNENDEPLFNEDQVIRLGAVNAAVLSVLAEPVKRLSGLTDEDLEDLEGNFGATPSGNNGSSSPPVSVAPSMSSTTGPGATGPSPATS